MMPVPQQQQQLLQLGTIIDDKMEEDVANLSDSESDKIDSVPVATTSNKYGGSDGAQVMLCVGGPIFRFQWQKLA